MKYVVPSAIAISVGIITLLGYFFSGTAIVALRLIFTDWAVILGGLAVLLGLANLLTVHARRVDAQSTGWVYSLLTALAALFTLVIGLVERIIAGTPTLYQQGSVTNILFNGVIVASQAALASLVMFFLVAAAVRLLRLRPNWWSAGFLVAILITLVGWLPFFGVASRVRDWIIAVPAAAGARGILIGVALGTIAIGLRVLTGVERPYRD